MAKTVVVTGASGALGSAVARALVAGGARVAALGSPRSTDAVTALARELGDACVPLAFDVGSADAWANALPELEARLGSPDGAVLAAGGWRGGAPVHAGESERTYAAMIAANLDTTYRSLSALLPGMAARGRGSVVLVGARAAVVPASSAGAAAYAAAKAGVVALAAACAAELPRGVRVNAVLPSTIDTPDNRKAMPDADFGRWVTLPSLAGVISFLLSDASRDVSGAAIPIYGAA